MRKSMTFLLGFGLSGLISTLADVVQLKENAAVTGKILVEKPDQVIVDLGFTVLAVPRSQIEKISRSETTEPQAPAAEPAAKVRRDLYYLSREAGPERPVREWVKKIGEAVVQVRTPGGLGSGFIINAEGYLITNFHVIEGETQISVEVYHQSSGALQRHSYKQVQIIALNKFADLALLKIDDKGAPPFAYVPLGDSDNLAAGERVFAIGSPMGLERTVTEGILSSKTRELEGTLYLQTTTQINPGNSGGPLFNLHGEVVGVTNMKLPLGEGIGFAIPIETVTYFLNHRDAFAYDNDNPRNPYRYLEPPSRIKAFTLPDS